MLVLPQILLSLHDVVKGGSYDLATLGEPPNP